MSKTNVLLESDVEGRAARESGPQQQPDHGAGTTARTSKSATTSHGSRAGKMPNQVEHMTVEERRAAGKAARAALPRERHGEWSPGQRRHDPLELLAEQA